jgi:hypothetical protein
VKLLGKLVKILQMNNINKQQIKNQEISLTSSTSQHLTFIASFISSASQTVSLSTALVTIPISSANRMKD